jgi:prepilin-type N-terminal cleavage/methylation domain-containing protein
MKLTRTPSPRIGFTLVELLVVIAIIAVLISLLGVALQKTVERQKNGSTKDQLNKLQQSLDSEYDRVVQKCAQDQTSGQIPDVVVSFCDNDKNRAKAVYTALHLRRQFPETFTEANSTLTLTDPATGNSYVLQPLTTFAAVKTLTSGTNAANEESGALLYMILANKAVGANSAMAQSADDLSQAATRQATFGATPLKTFSDPWGNSIGFRRWYGSNAATDNVIVQQPPYVDANPNPFNAANKDPLDTRNLLLGWSNTTKLTTLNNLPGATPAGLNLMFNGLNRTPTAYSPGKVPTPPTYVNGIWGYPLRRYGN